MLRAKTMFPVQQADTYFPGLWPQSTWWRLCREKVIPSLHLNRRYYLCVETLNDFFEKNELQDMPVASSNMKALK